MYRKAVVMHLWFAVDGKTDRGKVTDEKVVELRM